MLTPTHPKLPSTHTQHHTQTHTTHAHPNTHIHACTLNDTNAHTCTCTPQGLPKNLGGHDETGSRRVDLHITGDQPHITECCLEVTELLIGQRFDWGCVHGSEKKREKSIRWSRFHAVVLTTSCSGPKCPDYFMQWSLSVLHEVITTFRILAANVTLRDTALENDPVHKIHQ